jgi:hypothetical protein
MSSPFSRAAALLFSAALAHSVLAQSAVRPTGFLEIPWNSTPEKALELLRARGEFELPETVPTSGLLELTGGTFAGQPVTKWRLEFVKAQFASGTVTIKPETNPPALYREFKARLMEKYGPHTSERKLGPAPDPQGGKKRDRKESGLFGNVVQWKFPPTLADREKKALTVQLAAENGAPTMDEAALLLTVTYSNETLLEVASKAAGPKGPAPVDSDDL